MATPLQRKRSIKVVAQPISLREGNDEEQHVVYHFSVWDSTHKRRYQVERTLEEFDDLRTQMIKSRAEVARFAFPKRSLSRSASLRSDSSLRRSEGLQSWLKSMLELSNAHEGGPLAEFLGPPLSPGRNSPPTSPKMGMNLSDTIVENSPSVGAAGAPADAGIEMTKLEDFPPTDQSSSKPPDVDTTAQSTEIDDEGVPAERTTQDDTTLETPSTTAAANTQIDELGELPPLPLGPKDKQLLRKSSSKSFKDWVTWQRVKNLDEYEILAQYLPPQAVERIKREDEEKLKSHVLRRQSSSSLDAWKKLKQKELASDYDKIEQFYSAAAVERIKQADNETVVKGVEVQRSLSSMSLVRRVSRRAFSFKS